MDITAPRMTAGSSTLLRMLRFHVTLFLQSALLLASVTGANSSGPPLGAATTSVRELPGAGTYPGAEDWGPMARGPRESVTFAPGQATSREGDTAMWNGPVRPCAGEGEEVGSEGRPSEGNSLAGCQEAQRTKSRPRRSLAFPEGSKASLRVNFKYVLFNTSNWLAYANGFRTAWDLPKNGSVALPFARSIQRREIYRDIEEIMVYHGLDGRACILRGLCEATESIDAGSGIVRRLLHLLFTVPEEEEHHLEEYSPKEANWKMRVKEEESTSPTRCDSLFSSCPFSLLDMKTTNVS